MTPDIACGGRAEDGVRYGVRDCIGVRVTEQAMGVRNGLAAQDEGPALGKSMGVVPDSGTQHQRVAAGTASGQRRYAAAADSSMSE